jgi:transcriptional regulator with XRE-family HTH domain
VGTIKEILSKNIIERRHALGLTQADFAEKADISLGMAQKIEYQATWASPETLSKMADALETTVSWLLEDRSNMQGNLSIADAADILSKIAGLKPFYRSVVLALIYKDSNLIVEGNVSSDKLNNLFQILLKAQ